jgi:hypothetical protein
MHGSLERREVLGRKDRCVDRVLEGKPPLSHHRAHSLLGCGGQGYCRARDQSVALDEWGRALCDSGQARYGCDSDAAYEVGWEVWGL